MTATPPRLAMLARTRHAVFVASWLLAASAHAASYFVSPAGSDETGDGTLGAPYRSIDRTVETIAAPGDTIRLLAGLYRYTADQGSNFNVRPKDGQVIQAVGPGYATLDFEGIDIGQPAFDILSSDVSIEGGPTSRIVLTGLAGSSTTFGPISIIAANEHVANVSLKHVTIWPNTSIRPSLFVTASGPNGAVQNVSLEDVELLDCPQGAWGLWFRAYDPAFIDGIHLRSCNLEGSRGGNRAQTAMVFYPASLGAPLRVANVTVEDTRFGNWTQGIDGFALTHGSTFTFQRNTFIRSPFPDCGECDGIQFPQAPDEVFNVVIRENYFRGYDHCFDGGCTGLLFRRNVAYDNRDDFCYLNSTSGAQVDSNLAVHGGNDGFDLRNVSDSVFEYNTLYDFSSSLVDLESDCSNVTLRNNLFIDGMNEFNEPAMMLIGATIGAGNVFMNNIVYDPDPEDAYFTGVPGGTWEDFLDGYDLVEGVNTWWADPLWNTTKSPTRTGSFAPLSISPAIGNGTGGTTIGSRHEAVPRTWSVPIDVVTIAVAMDSAWGGDTVLMPPGTFPVSNLVLPRHVRVRSTAGPEQTILDANDAARHFIIEESSFLGGVEGLTLINGNAPTLGTGLYPNGKGGSVYVVGGSPVIANCIFTGNTAATSKGGALYLSAGTTAWVSNCTFHRNGALQGSSVAAEEAGTAPTVAVSILSGGTQGGATYADSLAVVAYACADSYGNAGGDALFGTRLLCFYEDPLFRDAAAGSFCLEPHSPCLPEGSDCGSLVGALGQCAPLGVSPPAAGSLPWLTARPNPFAREVRLGVQLPASGRAALEIFDASGRRVRTLPLGLLPSGAGEIVWDGTTDASEPLPPGVYFVRLPGSPAPPTRLVRLR